MIGFQTDVGLVKVSRSPSWSGDAIADMRGDGVGTAPCA